MYGKRCCRAVNDIGWWCSKYINQWYYHISFQMDLIINLICVDLCAFISFTFNNWNTGLVSHALVTEWTMWTCPPNEVIVQLIKTKCVPVLYYGLEACPLRKSQFSSLNFVINSTFRKVFDTRSQDVVDVCLEMFNCVPAEQTVAMRKAKFLKRVSNSNNMLCLTFAAEAAKELATL